jgi:hypothetical protein
VIAELIANDEIMGRAVFSPPMKRDEQRNIFLFLFEFEGGQPESLIWRKFFDNDSAVHLVSRSRLLTKQQKNPQIAYLGFGISVVLDIRQIKQENPQGCGFDVKHTPSQEEGDYHVDIFMDLAEGLDYRALTKSQKNNLKYTLAALFEPLLKYSSTDG